MSTRKSLKKSSSYDLKIININIYLHFREEDTAIKENQSTSNGLIQKMKASGKNIVIFFGSQTGTAEEFARRLAKNARLFGLKALVIDPEEIDIVVFFLIK